MITKRLTASRRAVSLQDTALLDLPRETLKRYEASRDIDDLGDLSSLSEKPTIFHFEPLRVEHEHYIDLIDSSILWRIFSIYVIKIENLILDDGQEIVWSETNGERRIKDECRELIPRDIVMEIAGVIIQAASKDGAAVPFSSRATSWEETRAQALIFRAMDRPVRTAKTA